MDFPRSMTPATCSALEPRSATAIASSHMRMRSRLPMLTQSDTAPMVQKRVLLPTAPKMKARANAPPVTYGASSFTAWLSTLRVGGEALLGALRRVGARVARDELLERPLRAGAIVHGFLRARDAQHGVGRLLALRPGGEEPALRVDRRLVVALPGVCHAGPVLRVRRELAAGIG